MATLWETITGNSTLPVQAGVNFWDHLNNQDGSGGGPTQLVVVEAFVDSNQVDIDATVEAVDVLAEVELPQIEITVEDEVIVDAESPDGLQTSHYHWRQGQ